MKNVLVALTALMVGSSAAHASDRGAVLERAAEVLETRYFDPALGGTLAQALREASAAGRFSGVDDPEAFARAVTVALREITPDLHLRLEYEPERELVSGITEDRIVTRETGGSRQMVRQSGRLDPESVEKLAAMNFGVPKVEVLPGNIGYLKMTRFVPAQLSRDTIRAAIDLLGNSDAVIIDVRGNPGGAPDAMGEVLNPFFSASNGPVVLHEAENRAAGARNTIATDPAESHPRLSSVPLFILTDRRTGSTAEMLAYAARRLQRATVIGETTIGAGRGANKHGVGDGFVMTLSEWRVLTGPGWEGVGVTPDVEIDAERALERALELATRAIAKRREVNG